MVVECFFEIFVFLSSEEDGDDKNAIKKSISKLVAKLIARAQWIVMQWDTAHLLSKIET